MKSLIPIFIILATLLVFVQISTTFASATTCPSNKPYPHWGVKNEQCLPSCGQGGGPTAVCSANPCTYNEYNVNSYDCNYCCVGSTYTTTTYYPTYTTTYYPTYYTTYYPGCYYPNCWQQTCSQKGGNICGSYQYCSGYYVSASDTSRCCIGSCISNVCSIQLTVQASPNQVQQGNSVTISGYATPSSSCQNIQVSLMVDNSNIGTVYATSNWYYSYSYYASGLSTGGHTITATATSPNCNSATAYTTLTVNSNQVCTPGQTRNMYCVNSYTSQYEQCSSDGNHWDTFTTYCSENQCVNGYCGSNTCTYGQTRNYQCYSSTSYSYEYCYGNYWQTMINSCPSNAYCSGGYCGGQYYPYYYSYYNNYGTLAVNVRDCANNNFVPATVQLWPGGTSQYSATGTVMFYGLNPTTYTISASSPDYATQSGSQTVYYNQQTYADICLNRNQVITPQPTGEHCLKVSNLASDGDIKSGETETFKATIKNCGTFTESSIKTRLDIFDKSSDASISSLAAGETRTVSISVDVPSDAAGKEKATLEVTNPYNSLVAEKTFSVLFGQPLVSVKDSYEAKRCEISTITFDLMNVGKAKETFTLSVSGPAQDWIHFSPDEIAVDAGDMVSVSAVAAVPCSAKLGDYTFIINAKDKTVASQTTQLRVIDGRSIIGMLIFPEIDSNGILLIGLIILIILAIIIITYLILRRGKRWYWIKSRELPGEPEVMPKN